MQKETIDKKVSKKPEFLWNGHVPTVYDYGENVKYRKHNVPNNTTYVRINKGLNEQLLLLLSYSNTERSVNINVSYTPDSNEPIHLKKTTSNSSSIEATISYDGNIPKKMQKEELHNAQEICNVLSRYVRQMDSRKESIIEYSGRDIKYAEMVESITKAVFPKMYETPKYQNIIGGLIGKMKNMLPFAGNNGVPKAEYNRV